MDWEAALADAKDRTEHVKQILATPRPDSLDPREAYRYLTDDIERILQVLLTEEQSIARDFVLTKDWDELVEWAGEKA